MLMPDHECLAKSNPRSQIPGEVWGWIPKLWSDWGLDPSAPASFRPRSQVRFGPRSWIFSQFWCWILEVWSILVPDPRLSVNFGARSWIFSQFWCRIPDLWLVSVPDPGSLVNFGAGSWVPRLGSTTGSQVDPTTGSGTLSPSQCPIPAPASASWHRVPASPSRRAGGVTVTRRHQGLVSTKPVSPSPGVTETRRCHRCRAVTVTEPCAATSTTPSVAG